MSMSEPNTSFEQTLQAAWQAVDAEQWQVAQQGFRRVLNQDPNNVSPRWLGFHRTQTIRLCHGLASIFQRACACTPLAQRDTFCVGNVIAKRRADSSNTFRFGNQDTNE